MINTLGEGRRGGTALTAGVAHPQAANETLFFVSPALISLCTFLPYVALGNPLTADVVFTVIALFSIIRLDVMNLLPKGVETASEARYERRVTAMERGGKGARAR